MRTAPCIVCGRLRGHRAEEHERYRREARRACDLLRRTWPRLAGLSRVLGPPPTPRPAAPGWWARVLPDGSVIHQVVREREG